MAFVVGVQHYQEPDLNKLQFTAKDAQDIFHQLQAVTELDLGSSRLLIAAEDVTETPGPATPPHVIRQQVLTSSDIQREFRGFLQRVKSNDQVIFYFGGHGKNQANRHLLFLPSNFFRDNPIEYLRYDDLLQDIKSRIDDANLSNVSVLFFANMCGAGTAAGTMSVEDDPDAEFVRRWLEDNSLGFQHFAFFPATAKGKNTHEDQSLRRSIFAHHLIVGLSGAAANEEKEITADSLFQYLNANIQDELPRHPDGFDGSILIGTTSEQEAMAAYLLGTSLLAVAADHDKPLLNKLALTQLSRVPQLSDKLGSLARVRTAQALASEGELARALDELTLASQDPILPDSVREEVQRLQQAIIEQPEPKFPTLKSYTQYLKQGGAFYVLMLLAGELSANFTDTKDMWTETLGNFPGYQKNYLLPFETSYRSQDYMARGWKALKRWQQEFRTAEPGAQQLPHLVIIWVGAAGYAGGRLVPVSQTNIEHLVKSWPGFVVVVYTAPFGGLLSKHDIGPEKRDVALFIAGTEDNAMTFSAGGSGKWGTSELMAAAIVEGVEEFSSWSPLKEYVDQHPGYEQYKQPKEGGSVIGKPTWLPSWRDPALPTMGENEAELQLGPLRRWPALLASGCVNQALSKCGDDLLKSLEREHRGDEESLPDNADLFYTLKTAARLDIAGESSDASMAYSEFLSQLDRIKPARSVEQPMLKNVYATAKAQMDRLGELVRDRLEGARGRSDRRIVLIRVAVEDYQSPYVADLNHAVHDLEIWAEALQNRFGAILDVKPMLKDPKDAESILRYVQEHAADASDDDLIVFVYSGRGYELAGNRYLTATNIELRSSDQIGVDKPMRYIWSTRGMVDLAEVAAAADGKWLFAVYDAQFTPPIHEPHRFSGLFNKHLDSVRPLFPETTVQSSVSGPSNFKRKSRVLPPRLVSSEDLPARQVHVFKEGHLTEAQHEINSCAALRNRGLMKSPPYSPLTAALLFSLAETEPTTYRTFADRVAGDDCLSTFSTGQAAGPIVFQGDLDIPLFATGKAAENIVYFLGDLERFELNLRTGLGIATLAEEGSREDLDRLTRVALQVLLVEQLDSLPGLLREQQKQKSSQLLAGALATLDEIDDRKLAQRYSFLDSAVLDLKTQSLRLAGRGEEARRLLLEAAPQLVGRHSELLQRLVTLTEEVLRSKPADVIMQTKSQMTAIKPSAAAWSPELRQRWEDLTEATLHSVREPYRIQSIER